MGGNIGFEGREDDERDQAKPSIKIKLNFDDLVGKEIRWPNLTRKQMQEYMEKYAEDALDKGAVSHNGSLYESLFGGKDISKMVSEMAAMYDVPTHSIGSEADDLQRSIWEAAMDLWDYPSGIRFTVWRQEPQASTLLTVEYLDPEQEAGVLVEATVEFLDEQLEQAQGGPELYVQRELEKLKDNCDADMAAFEPDGDEDA